MTSQSTIEPLKGFQPTSRQRRSARLVLVRHGKPAIEESVPPPQWHLSKAGDEAARTLGERLRDEGLICHRILSSPEVKALDTAHAIRAGLGVDAVVEASPGLSEHSREKSGFLPRDEFEQSIALLFRSDPSKLVFGDETADAAFRRFAAVIQQERLRDSLGTETSDIIAVTHGTIMSLYLGRILGIDSWEFWKGLEMPTAVIVSGGN